MLVVGFSGSLTDGEMLVVSISANMELQLIVKRTSQQAHLISKRLFIFSSFT